MLSCVQLERAELINSVDSPHHRPQKSKKKATNPERPATALCCLMQTWRSEYRSGCASSAPRFKKYSRCLNSAGNLRRRSNKVTGSLFNRETPHDPNYSVQYAIYLRLRRQPWKAMAIKTWHTLKHLFLLALVM